MNTAAQKMEQIREVFQAVKVFCAQENDLEKIVFYCENIEKEFRSIAYEAASMQIGLRDFEANNSLQNWKYFADDLAKPHAAQVYVGLGWAVAQESISLDKIIETLPSLLRYRVADGCGYYDGTFRNRQTVRSKQLPTYISGKSLQPYLQGVGRSLWYITKGNPEKTNELLNTFDEQYHADLWRGVGLAVAYVGGCDEETINSLSRFSDNYKPQLCCGVALAARSRIQADSLTEDAVPISIGICCCILCNRSVNEAAQITIDAECEDYFQWLKKIEEKLK